MLQYFKDLKKKRRKEKIRREKQWNINTDSRAFWLTHPQRYRLVELWGKWADMQTRVLAQIQQHWPEVHTYIRLHTYWSDIYTDILEPVAYETIIPIKKSKKNEQIILIPDCQDHRIWKTVLTNAALNPLDRCMFMLEHNPLNWQEVVNRLYEISYNLLDGEQFSAYKDELALCHCICYSVDEDLVFGKVDLPETTVLSILGNVAEEEGLELNVEITT